MAGKKSWFDKLSPQAKAEILASVLHQLEHMPKVWAKLSKKYRKAILRTLSDCSIWHEDLTKKDLKHIREWFSQ